MAKKNNNNLSRRERQIMDIIYQLKNATAAEVLERLDDPPSYSSVRALLRILVEKGHLRHKQQGPRYVFSPKINPEKAKRSAMQHMLKTFFDDSAINVVATLLDVSKSNLSDDELERLTQLIDKAKEEGR
jgi:predicted transcriptional regulator